MKSLCCPTEKTPATIPSRSGGIIPHGLNGVTQLPKNVLVCQTVGNLDRFPLPVLRRQSIQGQRKDILNIQGSGYITGVLGKRMGKQLHHPRFVGIPDVIQPGLLQQRLQIRHTRLLWPLKSSATAPFWRTCLYPGGLAVLGPVHPENNGLPVLSGSGYRLQTKTRPPGQHTPMRDQGKA